ncbi:hypothetical protein HNY73_013151 [Argiope bruennichi]|uniref:SOCS box domain-containing protein n=1 Tax=Argiope bruennichi TaxID=94029 RepID=A0A8T0F1R4_ARGBR|nr:hypothetical protein HNY73_013151 [Argiope bruennichi]
MWNVLCGNSDEAKFYVIGYFLNKSDDTDMLFYILEIAQAVKFNFWGMWFKKNEEDYLCFCPVTAALLQGNANQLAVLLLYGFEQNHGRVAIYDEYYKGEIYSKFKAPLEERNPSRRAILTEILLFLLLIQKEQSGPKFRSLIECFRRVWNINAVPFVTESELMDEIHRRFPYPIRQQSSRLFPHTAPQFIDLVENYYKFIKPEDVPEVVHPRSLQQLCKCSIRKILTRSYKMPEGIARLAIPEKLRKFLKIMIFQKSAVSVTGNCTPNVPIHCDFTEQRATTEFAVNPYHAVMKLNGCCFVT